MERRSRWWWLALALIALGCQTEAAPSGPAASARSSGPSSKAAVLPEVGDVAAGEALVREHECHRCHEGTGLAALPVDKHCVGCHQSILTGAFEAPAPALAEWRRNIVHLRHVPSLDRAGALLRPAWIASFLRAPHDLRPHLPATMPRLDVTEAEARDMAAYLTRDAPRVAPAAAEGDVERGRALFAAKQCGSCHAFTGADAAGLLAHAGDPRALAVGVLLAPDLRHTRERVRPEALAAWIADPQALRPGSPMPKTPLTEEEARDLAAFVARAPLAEPPAKTAPARLPLLERPVGYEEVSRRVLKKVCWHCHSQPDFARGDGGPGMSGGFGFRGRQLDLSSYEAVAGGYLDAAGEMASVFRPTADGTPMLVAVMLARQAEEVGRPSEVRGMPLGLPALSPEEIQLVETWIAQGRAR